MKLFVLRHGEAEAIASTDRQRQLTERGRQQIQSMVERNQKALADLELIYASPFVRTQQTVEEFMNCLSAFTGKQYSHQSEDRLVPNSSPQQVLNMLCSLEDNANVILVSHQPLVSELVSSLCDIDVNSISMPTATLATITLNPVGMGFGRLDAID